MTQEDYVHILFCKCNDKYEAEIKDRLLTKRVKEIRAELIKLLNEEQYQAFRYYDNCNYLHTLAEREKFFEKGFLSGFDASKTQSDF